MPSIPEARLFRNQSPFTGWCRFNSNQALTMELCMDQFKGYAHDRIAKLMTEPSSQQGPEKKVKIKKGTFSNREVAKQNFVSKKMVSFKNWCNPDNTLDKRNVGIACGLAVGGLMVAGGAFAAILSPPGLVIAGGLGVLAVAGVAKKLLDARKK